MNPQHEAQLAAKIKASLEQARPNQQIRQQLAAARQTALLADGARGRGPILVWVSHHRLASLASSAVLLSAIVWFWSSQTRPAPQYAENEIVAQVVDEVLYDSLDDF